MAFLAGAWVGCSSSTGPGGTGAQSCQGNPGDEYCSCNGGACNKDLTCALDLQQCVHIAGTPQPSTGGSSGAGNTMVTGAGNGSGSGGVTSTGGSAGTHATGSGGVTNTGGTGGTRVTGSGGMTNTGGSAGRTTGTGGMINGGAGGSGTSTGGTTVTSTACPNLMPSASGNGEFTYYYFGQGTYKEGSVYRTACGYSGTESGTTDTVTNIAQSGMAKNTYFAAIPGTNGFSSKASCGTCVQISNNGKTIIATIIDECPYGSDGNNAPCQSNPNGELDLSKSAFDALGFNGTGNPTGTSWKAVPCPVTGNVVVRIKSGNQNEAYIENTILALKSVSGPGGNASRQSYGAWHFNSNLGSGSQLTLTDVAGRSIQVTLGSGSMNQDQDTHQQFPACQ